MISTTSRIIRSAGWVLTFLVSAAAISQPSIETFHGKRRILILSAPSASDPALTMQRRLLAGWKSEAAARDLSTVEIIGTEVKGIPDSALNLRWRYRISAQDFAVVLIGKDGTVAEHYKKPIASADLQNAIDAMPMRRAGER